MKKVLFTLFLTGCFTSQLWAAEDTAVFKDSKEKFSYSLGMTLGDQWKTRDIEVDLDMLVRGLKDAYQGKPTLLTTDQMRQSLAEFQKEYAAKQEQKRKELADKNKKEGDAFLEANKSKPGVVTLPSGLQYKVITEGTGAMPKSNDTVVVNYRGTLIDGTEFDSSAKLGHPGTNSVNRYIKGWQEALEMMKVGSKWQLFIPPQLAYREFGHGRAVPPNATLIFDVELLNILPPAPPTPVRALTNQPVTSDIIKVPSAEGLKKGEKIEVIKKEDLEKEQNKAKDK